MPTPSLPVEVIAKIIGLASGPRLSKHSVNTNSLTLLCVSRLFRAETERLIYAHLVLNRPAQIVKCFKAILKRPSAARAVRSLTVSLPARSFPGLPLALGHGTRIGGDTTYLAAFARLVSSALSHMRSLKTYKICMGLQPIPMHTCFVDPWLTPGPFQLSEFSIDLDLSPRLLSFLEHQPSIAVLHAPSCAPRQKIPAYILPNLRTVTGGAQLLRSIVPGRPVSAVGMAQQAHSPQGIAALIPQLALSTGPITTLDMHIVDALFACEHVLPLLAHYIPNLTKLSMTSRAFANYSDPYVTYLDEAWRSGFAAFKELQSVIVSTADPQTFLDSAGIPFLDLFEGFPSNPGDLDAQDPDDVLPMENAGEEIPPVPLPETTLVDPPPGLDPLGPIPHNLFEPFPPQGTDFDLLGAPFPALPLNQNLPTNPNPPPAPHAPAEAAHAEGPPLGALFASLLAAAAGIHPPQGQAMPPGVHGPVPPPPNIEPHPPAPAAQAHFFFGFPPHVTGGQANPTNNGAAVPAMPQMPAGIANNFFGPVFAAQMGPPPASAVSTGPGPSTQPPPGPTPQPNIRTATFFGVINVPAGGPIPQNPLQVAGAAFSAISQQLPGMRSVFPPNPRREEALRNAQRRLAPRELEIIRSWSGVCPNLSSVCFEMNRFRYVTWNYQEGTWEPDYFEE